MAEIVAIGTVLSVAQTLFAALQNTHVQEICSFLGHQSQLESLKDTVSTIKAVLLDTADKQELSNEAIEWIKRLKLAVYDADDLLDEFTTLGEQHHLMEGDKVSKKVRRFFSRFGVAYLMSLGTRIRRIRRQFDGIARNHTQFGFSIDPQPIRRRREETCSYVSEDNVIGRENETKEIIDMLLNPCVGSNVSFLTIVGMGGLGKTTLAQLVYSHQRIKNEFPLRLWVCVGDYEQQHFDMKVILGKILGSAIDEKHENLELEVLQRKLREQREGKKYLLVLDDLWNEDRNECLKLRDLLMEGEKGSRILVTTRSDKVAIVVGDGHKYDLQRLSDDNSWQLYKKMAFKQGQEQSSSDLVVIGKEIVKKCANVPLAIRVIGTLLYGQDRTKWLSFQKIRVADIRQGKNDIMSILKFSYYHLEPELKSCFSYCALFPKDYEINKEMLISLWMAQGCIVPLDRGQSIEDAAEEYFSILVRRCFFQEVRKDEYGDEIVSCKIHDLMHDIAQEVAGKEICIANSNTMLDKEIHHLCLTSTDYREHISTRSRIRTYLHIGMRGKMFPVDTLLEKWTCLRTLDLHESGIKSLPGTIGELIHLRYLDLSFNGELKTLPKSITKLHNLQSLKLRSCKNLEELPKDVSQVIKLRVLDICGCDRLSHMPLGMDKLTCLVLLSDFIVADENSGSKKCVGQLQDLSALNNLKGSLRIRPCKYYTYVKGSDNEGGYLRKKEHLKEVQIEWEGNENKRKVDEEEALALLEDMEPHSNLKVLTLRGYCGVRMPSWGREDNLAINLPNLVRINLRKCSRLKYLPFLGKLRYLKRIELYELQNLEYMEISNSSDTASSSRVIEISFFPSLETLQLRFLPKLEGWWRDNPVVDGDSSSRHAMLPSFPCLIELNIWECPRLTSIPPCPGLENLYLDCFNEKLEIINGGDQRWVSTSENSPPKLEKIEISNLGYLKSLPTEAFRCLSNLTIRGDKKVESFAEVKEVFHSCSSTLRSLQIRSCNKLRGLSDWGLEHLTSLESLKIEDCLNLNLTEDEEADDGMPWKPLQHTLRSLRLWDLPKLVILPQGMQYLTSLHSLEISRCHNLKSLSGGGLEHLTSLEGLYIMRCMNLNLTEEEDDDGVMPWKFLGHTLRYLSLGNLPKLVNLPKGMQYLTSLRSLTIGRCQNMGVLPPWMPCLTSLQELSFHGCPGVKSLKERCQKPTGEDWPKIQHIPRVFIDGREYTRIKP